MLERLSIVNRDINNPSYQWVKDRLYPLVPRRKIRKSINQGEPVTVCIAAIFEGNCILGAADRMLTAGDIQFQPEQSKLYPFTKSIVAMVSGDVALHAEIYHEVGEIVKTRLAADSSKWFPVKEVVDEYEKAYSAVKRRRAQRDLLAPLGLSSESFIEKQSQMQPDIVNKLTSEILNYSMPDTGIIIAGVDDSGTHLYSGQDGKLTCEDAVGFSAIGAGSWHAQSQFMFARYSRKASAAKALYLVYAAKKRAETAPGVGPETDMFILGPQPGTYDEMKRTVIDDVAKIYEYNIRQSKRVYDRTERKVSEYIKKLGQTTSQPNEQEALPPPTDRTPPTDEQKTDETAPSEGGKKKG